MNRILVNVLAIGATTLAFVTPAGATPPNPSDPQGEKCRLNSADDRVADSRTQTDYIEIGPLFIRSADPDVRVDCRLYVNGSPGSGPRFNAIPTSVGGGEYLAYGITFVSFSASVDDVVALCTAAHYNGADLYWHQAPIGDINVGYWDQTFDVTTCAQITVIDPNGDARAPYRPIG